MIRSQLNSYSGNDPIWGFVALVGSERFTGEAAVGLDPRIHLYSLEGRVYYAERQGDAPVATRLVNCGALTAEQLEKGSVHLGEVDSLARLFQRQVLVDRDVVELTIEHATELLLESVADRPVGMPEIFPLRHHPAGLHHWVRSPIPTGTVPVETLGAEPVVDAEPVVALDVIASPEPVVVVEPEPMPADDEEDEVESTPTPVATPLAPTFAPLGLTPLTSISNLSPLTPEPEPEPEPDTEPDAEPDAEPAEKAAPATTFMPLSTLSELTPLNSAAFLSSIGAEPDHESTPIPTLIDLPALGARSPLPTNTAVTEPVPIRSSVTPPDLPRLATGPISVKDMDTGSVAIVPAHTATSEADADAPQSVATDIWDLVDDILVDDNLVADNLVDRPTAAPTVSADAETPGSGRGWLRGRKG